MGAERPAFAEPPSAGFISLAPALTPAPTPERWSNAFCAPGPSGTILATVSFRGDLIVAGRFPYMGSLRAGNIARWDGNEWHALGAGTNGEVSALAVYRDELIAAGSFTSIDGVPANRIARWDGATWRPLGDGVNKGVLCLAEYADTLFVGGYFDRAAGIEVGGLARWDGAAWTTARVPLIYHYRPGFFHLLVFEGKLLGIWGHLPGEDELIVWNAYFATWDGSSWSGMLHSYPSDIPLQPEAMAIHEGDLYAAGLWDETEHRVARLHGDEWSPVGAEIEGYPIDLISYQGRLILAVFSSGGYSRGYLAEWTGTEWARIEPGPIGTVFALSAIDSNLVAAGSFAFEQGPTVRGLAAWDGEDWRSIGAFPGRGCDEEVEVIEASPDAIIASGMLRTAGGTPADFGALWNGADWTALPASRPYRGFAYGSMTSIAVFDSEVHFAGLITTCGHEHCFPLQRYRNGDWESFSVCDDRTRTMVVHDGRLFLGGSFTAIDEVPFRRIAAWNGTRWTAIGPGLNNAVFDIAAFRDEIVAVGAFDATGSEAAPLPGGVAGWDGIEWHPFGHGPEIVADRVVEHAHGLVVSGSIQGDRPQSATYHVLRWDGRFWRPLGGSPDKAVEALVNYRGRLIASGGFTRFGNVETPYLAEWDGRRWIPFGGGASGKVNDLAVRGDDLFAGGEFQLAGTTPSWNFAQWSESLAEPLFLEVESLADSVALSWWVPPDPEIDGFLVRYAFEDFPTGPEGGEPLPGSSGDGRFESHGGTRMRVAHARSADGRVLLYVVYAYSEDGSLSRPVYARALRPDLTSPDLTLVVRHDRFSESSLTIELDSSEPLHPPSVRALLGDEARPLTPRGSDMLGWSALVPLPVDADSLRIEVCGADTASNLSCRAMSMSCRTISRTSGGRIASPDGRLTAEIPPYSNDRDRAFSITQDGPDSSGGRRYGIGPLALSVPGVWLTFHLSEDETDGVDLRRYMVERVAFGNLASYIDFEERTVTAPTSWLGTYRLVLAPEPVSSPIDARHLALESIHPNPARGETRIRIELRASVEAQIEVYDAAGRRVAVPFHGVAGPGVQEIVWDGRTRTGATAPGGIYFVKVTTPWNSAVGRFVRVR